MIYLASPYSHVDPAIREQRYLGALAALKKLLDQGRWTYSPIVHCHDLSIRFDLAWDAKFWEQYDRHMIRSARTVIVLTLPGWDVSVGVAAERAYAERLGMSIEMMEPV